MVAGLVMNMMSSGLVIESSYNTGKVISIMGMASGISYLPDSINNCYNQGEIIGLTTYGITAYVHSTDNENITNCYNSGKFTSGYEEEPESASGAGISEYGNLKNCYWYKENSNIDRITGEEVTILENVQELSLEQMKKQESFAGFDFINTWKIVEGQEFPKLKYQN